MMHWIFGIKDRDETPSASLLQNLGIEDIMEVSDGIDMYSVPRHVSNLSKT